ncbi:MAG: hypothetical protein H6818_12760 [Phycisphaerales bacterium]|nr:hypothetical protein [Phycisphaerales bacterium]
MIERLDRARIDALPPPEVVDHPADLALEFPDVIIVTDHSCRQCSYNLRGLSAAGRCPECGAGIDLSQQPRYRGLVAFLESVATAALVLLIVVVVVLDLAFAASVHIRFVVIAWALAAIVAAPSWWVTRKGGIGRLFLVISAMLVVLPYVPHTRVKSYAMFYACIKPGMTRTDVLARLDDYYPDRASTDVPTVRVDSADRLSLTLGGDNTPYNAECIVIRFTNGIVIAKSYSPD